MKNLRRFLPVMIIFLVSYLMAKNWDVVANVYTDGVPQENALVRYVVGADTIDFGVTDEAGEVKNQVTPIEEAKSFMPSEFGLKAYPSAVEAGGVVHTEVSSPHRENYSVKVFDMLGRDVTQNLSSLAQGMYVVGVELDGRLYGQKVFANGGFSLDNKVVSVQERPVGSLSKSSGIDTPIEFIVTHPDNEDLTKLKEQRQQQINNRKKALLVVGGVGLAVPALAQDGGTFTMGDRTVTGYALGLDGRPLVGKAFFAINGDTTSYDIGADGRISATLTDIEEVKNNPIPKSFALSNNYPNPFNDKTSFDVSTAKPTVGHIALYNTLGQKVRDWPISLRRGTTTFAMDGDLAQGMYFVQVMTEQGRVAQKVIDLDGAFTNKPGLSLSQQNYSSDVPVALDEALQVESLGKTAGVNSDVYTMWLEGTNADGVPLTKFHAMRTQNQDPGQENVGTASYSSGELVPMMIPANNIPNAFMWYAIDQSVPLDTLKHITVGTGFSARWENYVTQQFTMDYNNGDPIGSVPDSVFEKQDRLLSELRDIYVFNTPAGTDTLLWTTNERTDSPNWAQRGYHGWEVNNASTPVHSKMFVAENKIQKLAYSLGRVKETSALGFYYGEYFPGAACAFDDYRPTDGSPRTGFGQMITTVNEDNKVVIGKNAYDFLRIGLLFKGKIVGSLD